MARLLDAVLGVLLAAPPLAAQSQVIPDEVGCAACRIEIETIAVLGDADGPVILPGQPIALAEDGSGRFWITYRGQEPLVLDASGDLVGSVGSVGAGPGEFVSPTIVFPVADSVVILDPRNRRASVVAPDLSVSRMIMLEGSFLSAAPIDWPQSVILSGRTASRVARAEPLHIARFDEDQMSVVSSVGHDGREPLTGDPWSSLRYVFPAEDGTIWAAHPHHYRVRRIDGLGNVIETVERSAPWFAGEPMYSHGTPTQPPPSHLRGVTVDQAGRLWVFVHTAASTWADAWPSLPPGTREVSTRAIRQDLLYETTVEVIDREKAVVLARTKLKGLVSAVLPGGRVALYEEDEIGVPRVRVARMGLRNETVR